jgi:AAA family ATP:ADP antiporter
MIAVNPPFAALVARLPRVRFIAFTYRFFIANLLLFALLLHTATNAQNIWLGRVFFIWASVFNLFVVSVFWAVMVDVFDTEQSKRLFGFIAAGATLGGIAGSSITASFATALPASYLLLVSALLLEVAIFGVRRLSRLSQALSRTPAARSDEQPIGGSILSGITHTFKSPYLASVGVYILLFTITSTFLYFQQAEIARQAFPNRGARTAFFAQVDLSVNILTLGAQLFATAPVLRAIGVAFTLALLPTLSVVGFSGLALAPSMLVLVVYQVLRRAGNFAFARPTREVLFTVVAREDRYKAKSFLDTVVYRTGDQIGAWAYAGLGFLGVGIAGASAVAVPLSFVWLFNSFWLGRRQEKIARAQAQGV